MLTTTCEWILTSGISMC